jgi:hypothetical protein
VGDTKLRASVAAPPLLGGSKVRNACRRPGLSGDHRNAAAVLRSDNRRGAACGCAATRACGASSRCAFAALARRVRGPVPRPAGAETRACAADRASASSTIAAAGGRSAAASRASLADDTASTRRPASRRTTRSARTVRPSSSQTRIRCIRAVRGGAGTPHSRRGRSRRGCRSRHRPVRELDGR